MAITINLHDNTSLNPAVAQAYVAGWINGGASNFQVLQAPSNGVSTFGSPSSTLPFYLVSDISSLSFSGTTNGNDRLLFVVSATPPTPLTISNLNPIQYTQFPYANAPGVAAPGPFDVFEFGMNAQADVSAVSGFGLNLRFSVEIAGSQNNFGVNGEFCRRDMGNAFQKFIANEAKSLPSASAFAQLLYDQALPLNGAPTPPCVDTQYFGICDPNDMLGALSNNYTGTTDNPLASYWDATLTDFFAAGNYLSINLSADPSNPNIYSGVSALDSSTNSLAYTLSNGSNTYQFFMPPAGLQSAQYVFQQAFGSLTPAGAAGDAGLLQDSIWEALCRGVANSGVSKTAITQGESTTAWNSFANWYQAGTVCHLYAKFMHYGAFDGSDSRISGQPPFFLNNAAYGFSMDEIPLGPYNGPNVPSKTIPNVPDGSTIDLFVGPWDLEPA